jgi:SpoVK/Ycf46/Vps4 family AAA+-type ATPase
MSSAPSSAPSSEYIAGLRAALAATPNNTALRLLLAKTLGEAALFDQALVEYQSTNTADPHNFEAAFGLGKTLLQLNKAKEAKPALAQAIKLNESHAEAHLLYAQALSAAGDFGEAFVQQGIAVKLDPNLKIKLTNNQSSDQQSAISDQPLANNVVTKERSAITFEDVGGMDAVKERIRLSIIYPIQKPEIYKAYGKKAGGGLLLYGPPGCGKTYIARATAGEVKAEFIYVGLNDVLDMYLGESERKLHAVFESARRQAPAVLFFDEVDAIGNSRMNLRNSAGRNLVNQFLNEMDGMQGDNEGLLILGATNAPWDVDSALRRPGRFGHAIFVEPPDYVARLAILQLHLRDKPHVGMNLNAIAQRSEGYSGADLMAIVDAASERAMTDAIKSGTVRPITEQDMTEAMKAVKASINEWIQIAQNYVMYSNQSGFYDDVAEYLKRVKRK